jgi:uncharacterized protein YdhG (YjbR/CyaY superfamily)
VAEKFATVEEYIASSPPDVRAVLEEVRRTIRAAVPESGEKISYQIPAITPLNEPIPYDLITSLTQAFVAAR